MEFFLIMVVIAIIVHAIGSSLILRHERKNWMYGHKYMPNDKDGWMTAKLSADPDNVEFQVKYVFEGGFFVDKDGFGYIPNEIKIKRDERERGTENA